MKPELPFPATAREEKKRLSAALLFTVLLGFAAHGYQFFTLNLFHDGLHNAFPHPDYYLGAALGRGLQYVYTQIFGSAVYLPLTSGLLTLLWMGLAVWAVCCLFRFDRLWQIGLTAALFVTNQTVTATAGTYPPYLSMFAFALLCAALAALCWGAFSRSGIWLYLLPGALLVTVSLGIYQSYIFTAAVLIMLASLLALLENAPFKAVFLHGLGGAAMLAAGGGLYLPLTGLICQLTGTPLETDGYNSLGNLAENAEPLTERITACFTQFSDRFFKELPSVYPERFILLLNAALLVLTLVLLAAVIVRRRVKPLSLGLAVLLLVLLPFAANGTRLINREVHDLMEFAFCLVYLIPLMLIPLLPCPKAGKICGGLCAALLAVLVFSNIQTANLLYTIRAVEYQANLSLMTNVVERVETREGYIPGETPVVFLGTPGDVLEPLPQQEKVEQILSGYLRSPISYYHTWHIYFERVLLRDVNIQEPGTLAQDEAVLNLPPYPAEDSISMVNGTVVVKFK